MAESITKPDTSEKTKTKRPARYKVIILNDDYTTMDFVVWVIMRVFNRDETEASKIMMEIHQNGKGVCGIYPLDIAETKSKKVMTLARQNGHPLTSTLELVEGEG